MAQQTTLPSVPTENPPSCVELNLLPPDGLDQSIWRSLADNIRGWLHPEKLPPLELTSKPVEDNDLLPRTDAERSLFSSLRDNIKSTFFPEKLPPLEVSSKPIKVRNIWGAYDYKQEGAGVSLMVHVVLIAGLIALSILTSRGVKLKQQSQNSISIADDMPVELPVTAKKGNMGGGGGGGDRDKLDATKG